jgi:hypothetical protein
VVDNIKTLAGQLGIRNFGASLLCCPKGLRN